MNGAVFTYRELRELVGGQIGRHDVACPICGPAPGRTAFSAKRKILRIWLRPDFATYYCVRCDTSGSAHQCGAVSASADVVKRMQSEIAARERSEIAEQLAKARWLWAHREPLRGSVAEVYLRDARRYAGPAPTTLGFLPPRRDFSPAMIAAYGFADEPEPGRLNLPPDHLAGVHITWLKPDGSGKASDPAKISIGRCKGTPIVLAPPNDLMALAITEGIEDGLSVHEAARVGVWAAGSAGRMAALADAVPRYVQHVTVIGDPDDAGRRGALGLEAGLKARGIDVAVIFPGEQRCPA